MEEAPFVFAPRFLITRRRSLFFVLLLSLSIRLLAIHTYGAEVLRFGDAPDYLAAARDVCVSGSYPNRSSMPFFRAPGLPLFIAISTLCHPNYVAVTKIALALVDAASVAVIYFLGDIFGLSPLAGLISAGIAAIWPFFVGQVCDVQSEPVFMACFLGAILLAMRGARSGSFFALCAAGLSAGAAALVRPIGLLLPLLLCAIPGAAGGKRPGGRIILGIALGALCSIGPWAVRNGLRYREPILVNDAGGYNFWRATSPEMAAIDGISDPRRFYSASIRFETVISPAYARRVDAAAASPLARDREWRRLAMENLANHTDVFLRQLGRNAWAYWRPWLNPQNHSQRTVIASGLLVMGLYVFAMRGFVIAWKVSRPLALWCGVAALVFWLANIPFQVTSRFRSPISDPFLIVFATLFLSRPKKTI